MYTTNIKTFLFLICLSFFPALLSAAERSKAEELEQSLASLEGAQKSVVLSELVWLYRNNDTEKAFIYGEEALVLLHQYPNLRIEAKVLYSISWAHMRNGDYERATLRAKLAQDVAKQIGDKEAEAYAINVLGSVEWFKGNFLNSLDYFLKTLDLRLAAGDKLNIARSYNNIGSVYQEIGDFDKAKEYHELSLEMMKTVEYAYGIATSNFNLGIIHQRLNNLDEQQKYLETALNAFIELKDKAAITEVQINLGQLHLQLDRIEEASTVFESSKNLSTELDNQSLLSRSLLGVSSVKLRRNELQDALTEINRSLEIALQLEEKTQLRDIYSTQSEIYKRLGNFEKALVALEKHHLNKSAILENVYEGNLSLLQQKFDSEQSKARIETLEREKALSELQTAQAEREYQFLLWGFALTAFLITIIVFQYIKLLRTNRQTYLNSITDSLCGCFNRHYLFSALIPKLVASENSVYSMLVDLDKFKSVNDQYGHDIGDQLLSKFSQRVLSILSESDYLIRLGGEEFLITGNSLNRERSLALAERVKNVVSDSAFILGENTKLEITCSIGVSFDKVENENQVIELIKKADLAMYQAKREGRNRVIGGYLRK